MCGIAGIIHPNASNYKSNLRKMTQVMAHRGPDSEGFEYYPKAALAHRRLSLIDLSPTGKQPMYSNTKEECIVLNGEIYGFQDIKNNYQTYPFQGTSDTELVLAMYQKKKQKLIEDLPGMFAFAIWDNNTEELFCARDRFGEKPFYYAFGDNGEFIFASELKAILSTNLLQPKINESALYHYLQYGQINAQQTIFSNIYTLPPAHTLLLKNGKVKIERYWKIPQNDSTISLDQAVEKFKFLLVQSIRKQLVSDVEVGCFLSGGLDSSTITAMSCKYTNNLTTLAFGYKNKDSELKFAKEIAQKYNTNHIEIVEGEHSIVDLLKEITPFLDEPLHDMSFIPTYQICKSAAKQLKVMLSGDVGDELFGGYSFYEQENIFKNHPLYHQKLKKSVYKQLLKVKKASFVTESIVKHKNILDFHQNKVRNYLIESEINSLGLTTNFEQEYSFKANPDSLNDIMRTDLEKYVPSNMLMKSDRMAMANSLEVRTPFLDIDFAEFCISLPENLKINTQNDKIILREAAGELWTDTIRKRKKQGFGSKVSYWYKDEVFNNYSNEILSDKSNKMFEYLDYSAVQNLKNNDTKEWNLLQLALWFNNYKKYI